MSSAQRRWIGAAAMTAFVIVYIAVAMIVGAIWILPLPPMAQLAFYMLAGFAWVLPAMAIIKWMRRPSGTDVG